MELKEIKKGEIGTGLLIEQDAGYISFDDERNKPILEAIQNNEDNLIKEPLIVYCVLQKFGIKNANGRVYPERILKREWDKYISKIKSRSAYGECYTPDTLILTENGWKQLSDITVGEIILTLNTNNNKIEKKPILRKISYPYKGKMIRIKGDEINDLVTPDHKYPLFNTDHSFSNFYSASDIKNKKIHNLSDLYIPKQDDSLEKISQDKIYLSDKLITISEEEYNGDVMCVEVENHTWYCMCNGLSHWTGNCNHPETSIIDLERLSINIIDGWWEGNTLVGKAEIIMSPGFVKYGICSTKGDVIANLLRLKYKIGVSSRGIGSVKSEMNVQVVQDDFEIICWDVVSDPSTPGAWIVKTEDDTQQYVEDVQKQGNPLMEGLDNFLNKDIKIL